jgi:hypothetical protein
LRKGCQKSLAAFSFISLLGHMMPETMKITVTHYFLRILLLVASTLYIYFVSPFAGNLFFLLFFIFLVIVAIIHRYALVISDSRIVYRPLPLFVTKKVNLMNIQNIGFLEDQITITTRDEKTITIRKYYLQTSQWPATTNKMKEISGNLKS